MSQNKISTVLNIWFYDVSWESMIIYVLWRVFSYSVNAPLWRKESNFLHL